jgi:hypothetical protein
MGEPQLSVRSAKAHELAHSLAKSERCTITEVVERALEMYQSRQLGREPAQVFYQRMIHEYGTDLQLEMAIREQRTVHSGIDL